MAKSKISIADAFYDRCCAEYTLKTREGGFTNLGKLGGKNCRVSTYRIENVGTVSLIRAEGSFGAKNEACVFVPQEKDAPLLLVDSCRTLFKESLSINLVKTQLAELNYRQFQTMEESAGKLGDADVPAAWYNSLLVKGSLAKTGKDEELAALLEDYLDAYLRVVEYAEKCDPAEKAEKTKAFSHGLIEQGGLTADRVTKSIGPEKTAELFDRLIFPVVR